MMLLVFKVIKINVLALLSLPLFLISVGAKLVLKALEKALVFLGVGAALLTLFLLNGIFNNPGSFLNGLGTFVAVLILFGIIIAIVAGILVFFGSIAAAVVSFIVLILMSVLNFIFEFSHDGYSKLYDICKTDVEQLAASEEHGKAKHACLFWYVLKYFNIGIVYLFSAAFPVSIAAGAGFALYCFISVQAGVRSTFGIGIFSYLKLFPVINTVFSVLYFLIITISIVVVIISLGIEWGEWGQLLKLSTQSYSDYKAAMQKKHQELNSSGSADYSFEAGKSAERCQQYMDSLNEMFGEAEALQQQIDTAMHIKYDSSVVYDFSEYMDALSGLSKLLSAYTSEIPCDVFEHRMIPLIEKAQKQYHSIVKRILNIINRSGAAAAAPDSVMDFFGGCTTGEDIKKRYKALCKVYHPDAAGHEETFKILQSQYEDRIKDSSAS